MNTLTKPTLNAALDALENFVNTRPGLDPMLYGDASSYRADQRANTQARNDALIMINALHRINNSEYYPAPLLDLDRAFRAFSGRLTYTTREDGSLELDYCAGQFYAVEYRRAVCAVVANMLWQSFRADGIDTCERIYKAAKNAFGSGIANRWFK